MPVAIYFIAGSVLLVVGVIYLIRKLLSKAMADVNAEYPEHTRILTCPMANLFGVKSSGMKQIRGNGILLLTASEIYFRMLLPAREFRVPLGSIKSVETPVSFLGKTKGIKLLKIDFINDTGEADSAAWLVSDLEKWVETIKRSAELN